MCWKVRKKSREKRIAHGTRDLVVGWMGGQKRNKLENIRSNSLKSESMVWINRGSLG